jgi:hypothetical protein
MAGMATRRRLWMGLGGAALVMAASTGAASAHAPPGAEPPAPSSTVSGVTVTAPEKPNPLVDPTTQFVRQHLPASTFSEQYPRFRDAICVKVQGLPPEFDAFVARRIGEIAAQVHAPVAKAANCQPNVHVIFSPQPQALLADIAKRKDILLGFYWNESNLKRLATFNRPIGGWYVTRTRGQSGESRLEIHDPTDYLNPRVGRAGSRLSNGMSTEVVHSLILADANKVAGEKIDAVADYIAVLALAKWQGLERCNATPTILNLMAEGCADRPEAATSADLALLAGLYSVDPRELGSQQRATIASAIRKADASDKESR